MRENISNKDHKMFEIDRFSKTNYPTEVLKSTIQITDLERTNLNSSQTQFKNWSYSYLNNSLSSISSKVLDFVTSEVI